MTREEYLLIFEKYLSGKATAEEIEMLLAHEDGFNLEEQDEHVNVELYAEKENRILNKLESNINPSSHKNNYRKLYWLAASIILIISAASVFLLKQNTNTSLLTAKNSVSKNDIKPASNNNALLTLPNGKEIILNEIKAGTELHQGNLSVKKQANGLLQINTLAQTHLKHTGNDLNTISTPIGGRYEVVLPDGSKVWLNAASTLKFPSVFTGSERKVELTGEAYFEVAKNRQLPFKVQFDNNVVEVLGTHFNIMAYKNEDYFKTTLLEGSVRISKSGIKKILIPGQQAVTNQNELGINVSSGDTEQAIAWKDNVFLFHNENIRSIMRQLSRWYDIDVVYQTNTEHKDYGIRMSKSKNLSEILKNMELTGTIHFNIEGRRITVME